MNREYSVKGSTIKSKLGFIESRFGNRALKELEENMEQEEFPAIFDSGWYPFGIYVRLLQIISDAHFAGDISRLTEVGEYSAKESLGETYRTFVSKRSFVDFIKNSSQLHHMFYSEGKTEVIIDEGGGGCRIVHIGKPEVSKEDLYVALGFYRGAAYLHGIRSIQGRFTPLRDGAEFILSWSE